MTPIKLSDTTNPLPACPDSPNCERESYQFDNNKEKLHETVLVVLSKMRAHSVDVSEAGEIHAIFRIPIFGWKDDVSIVFEATDDATILHIRSASRTGHSDLGVNKRRVNRLIRWVEAELK